MQIKKVGNNRADAKDAPSGNAKFLNSPKALKFGRKGGGKKG